MRRPQGTGRHARGTTVSGVAAGGSRASPHPARHLALVALERGDLNVINLECVLSDRSQLHKPFANILISPERYLRFLVDNRINVVTTANNHARPPHPCHWSDDHCPRLARPVPASPATRRLARELESLEQSIYAAENRKTELEAQFSDPATYGDDDRARRCSLAYDDVKTNLASWYLRWEELHEELELLSAGQA